MKRVPAPALPLVTRALGPALPLVTRVLLPALLLGCHGPELATRVAACPALTGDLDSGPDDFTRVACATSARVRLSTGASRCLPIDSVAGFLRGESPRVELPASQGPLSVEVALFAPGVSSCSDEAGPLALGRSAAVTPASGAVLTVPLALRDACANPIERIPTLPYDLVEGTAISSTIAFTPGEIFPFAAMESTGGACASPDAALARGEFRPFAFTQVDALLSGRFAFDHSPATGCLALRSQVSDGSGAIYSCLDETRADPGFAVPLLDAAHWHRAVDLQPAGATHGALVIRIANASDEPVAGAHVLFAGTGVEAVYPSDTGWTAFDSNGTAGIGIALVPDAPTGRYRITGNGAAQDTLFNAGAPADPLSVTLLPTQR